MRKKEKYPIIIYIVDDKKLDAEVLAQEFEMNTNYRLHLFNSGEQFLRDIIVNPPPKKSIVIALIEYQLNYSNIDAKDGIEILKTLKEINHDYEVIMTSSKPDVDIVTSALHYEAVTFVKKNENYFLRIQNNINWIVSKKILKRKRMASLSTILIFIVVTIFVASAILIVSNYFPELLHK